MSDLDVSAIVEGLKQIRIGMENEGWSESWFPQVDQAISALQELSRDARRLDWLESMGKKRHGILLHSEENTGRLGLGLSNPNRTLREACDQAMGESRE